MCMRPWIRSLSNILPKRPLRDAFPAQNTILSAQKAPALRDAFLAQNIILSAQKVPAVRPSVIPKAKYMTLGPKFYTKLVSAITRRRMNENQLFFGESSQNFT